jgi:hypothetical protein
MPCLVCSSSTLFYPLSWAHDVSNDTKYLSEPHYCQNPASAREKDGAVEAQNSAVQTKTTARKAQVGLGFPKSLYSR